jgi:putative ABC transport system permease protein
MTPPPARSSGSSATCAGGASEVDQEPAIYSAFQRNPIDIVIFAVRSRAPAGLAAAMSRELAAVDAELPLGELTPMTESLRGGMEGRRLNTLLLGAFGAVALTLALLGV